MEKQNFADQIGNLSRTEVVPEVLSKSIFKNATDTIKDWASFRDSKHTDLRENLFLGEINHNNHQYTGLLNYEIERDHFGIHKYDNGDIYSGEWKNNKRHGNGVYLNYKPLSSDKRVNIEIFMGKWEDDKLSSEGVHCWIEEAEKNTNFEKCDFHAFVGSLNEDTSFKRGVYLTKTLKKFYIYYGAFKDGVKNDDRCYFYDNDFTIDRVFRGKIINDEVQEGFFVSFYEDDINDTVFLKFDGGEPSKVTSRPDIDKKILKKIDTDSLQFRDILYEDDWFNMVYDKAKEAYKSIHNYKMEDFNNEKKFKELVKIAASYKDVAVYSNLSSKL
jgi:hypothetical protein